MGDYELLMIKLFKARKNDYAQRKGGSRAFAPLVKVTPNLRTTLAAQASDVEDYFRAAFNRWPSMPCIAKVCLREDALAKSKRPTELFDATTCPIVGSDKLGTIYISVTRDGIRSVESLLKNGDSEIAESHISTVKSISPFAKEDTHANVSLARLKRVAHSENLRLQLFNHDDAEKNTAVANAIAEIVDPTVMHQLDYPSGLKVFDISATPAMVAKLVGFPGTQSLSQYTQYGVVRTTSRMVGAFPARRFPAPVGGEQYPLVGIIDTGTDPHNQRLQRWVEERFEFVPAELQDNSHGSFVAGLVCNSRALNDGDDRFPSCSARIVDVVAFDKTGEINERDLMRIIKDAVTRFRNVKVWNLSFAVVGRTVSDHQFSPLAMLLEELRRKYGVSFVIAAGNTDPETIPPQPWPRTYDYANRDRICSPADAPTGIVVGGLAHLDSDTSCVKINEPSPWSRCGPGTVFLPSPHLSHWSGNCRPDNDYARLGIYSLDGLGNMAEDVGTSFAAPMVSSLLANVAAEVATEDEPHVLSHAILMHSAFLRNPLDQSRFNYVGAGTPPDIDEVLHCRQSSATIIFEVDFGNKPLVMKHDFPIPESMRDGSRLIGQIMMTLVYDPPVQPIAGPEYCQLNVNVSLGTIGKKGRLQRRINTWPQFSEETRERDMVRYGFRWSPVKFYHRNFDLRDNSLATEEWKLHLSANTRFGCRRGESHVAYLVITMRNNDRDKQSQIYTELVQAMQARGWAANDLKLRSRSRNYPY